MGDVEGERHVIIGLPAGIAEHHPLVAGTLFVFVGPVDAAVDIGRLLVNGIEDPAGIPFKTVLPLGIPDGIDDAARNLGHIDVCLRLDLACHDNLAGGHKGFNGYFRFGVECQELVDHGIGDLVGDLVRVTFRNRF